MRHRIRVPTRLPPSLSLSLPSIPTPSRFSRLRLRRCSSLMRFLEGASLEGIGTSFLPVGSGDFRDSATRSTDVGRVLLTYAMFQAWDGMHHRRYHRWNITPGRIEFDLGRNDRLEKNNGFSTVDNASFLNWTMILSRCEVAVSSPVEILYRAIWWRKGRREREREFEEWSFREMVSLPRFAFPPLCNLHCQIETLLTLLSFLIVS